MFSPRIIKCVALTDINQDVTPVRRTSTLLITAIPEEHGGKTLSALLGVRQEIK